MQRAPRHASIGFVSTYPPTVCGIATYTSSLLRAVARSRGSHSGLGVVSLTDEPLSPLPPDVLLHHRRGDAASLNQAAEVLCTFDTVSIQHEFGIFGGPDGEEVLDLAEQVDVPISVTFHTVLERATSRQRMIVDGLCQAADRVLVMSETASERLVRRYAVDPARVEVIPHGADARFAGPSLVTGHRPLVLTWGLIGPGKGLEWAVEAFASLTDLDPLPRYLIAGATHPQVRQEAGESYRESLVASVRRLGLDGVVELDDRYLDRDALARLVRSADLVVLPYVSFEQVTSGVLVEAIAASKPVVATRFPHAVELLSGGAGITVPHGDPEALASALRRLLLDRRLAASMARKAGRMADSWYWPTVGERFGSMMSSMSQVAGVSAARTRMGVQRVAG